MAAGVKSTVELIAASEAAIEAGRKMQPAVTKALEQINMAHEQLQGGQTITQHPGTAKPMITAEQYARGREVLEALPPGVYLKCSGCKLWWTNSDVTYVWVSGNPTFLCERCA